MRGLAERTIGKQEIGQSNDFSLVLGGPLYQLLLRCRLIQPPLGNLRGRIALVVAVAWLPLVVLTIFFGRFAGEVKVPFLHDFEVHARLLFALPLMIVAEVFVYIRMRGLVTSFVERQIVTANVRPAFDAVISSAMRLRNSLAAEIGLLLFVILAGHYIWQEGLALHSDTWYATASSSSRSYTPAGYWYSFVSVPVFQFILIRWYYRIFIWCRFLFQVSRLDLNLVALHPDRCCGLGFLGNVALAFSPLLMAHTGVVSGFIANRIVYEGSTLSNYRLELVGLAVLLLAIVLGPLCVFILKLNAARLAGLRTYGRLASDYVVGFAGKWAGGAMVAREPLLGSPDIQSLADLANSFAIVKGTKLAPFGKDTVMRFLVVIALPLAPLAFTMFSVEELLSRLIKVLF
jgi:hypothetical protein